MASPGLISNTSPRCKGFFLCEQLPELAAGLSMCVSVCAAVCVAVRVAVCAVCVAVCAAVRVAVCIVVCVALAIVAESLSIPIPSISMPSIRRCELGRDLPPVPRPT